MEPVQDGFFLGQNLVSGKGIVTKAQQILDLQTLLFWVS